MLHHVHQLISNLACLPFGASYVAHSGFIWDFAILSLSIIVSSFSKLSAKQSSDFNASLNKDALKSAKQSSDFIASLKKDVMKSENCLMAAEEDEALY